MFCICAACLWLQVSDCLHTSCRHVLPCLEAAHATVCSRTEVAQRLAEGCSRRAAAVHSDARAAHIDALVKAGLLARQASDRFSFALPGVGPLLKSIMSGRKVRAC